MKPPIWKDVPLDWRLETVVALCRIAMHSPDPEQRVREFLDEAGDGDEAAIVFVHFAWSHLRHLPQYELEMEVRKVQEIMRTGDTRAGDAIL